MALTVTHSTVVVTPDDGTSEVGSDEWNAAHTVGGSLDASDVAFTPAGDIAATDVQAAIDELDDEKQPLDADLTSWAGVTRAAGFDTFAGTPSSANLRSLLSDESGTGVAYFQGGDAGTPSALVLTNATGLTTGGVTAATLVTAADTVASNDNDTTWPTTAAIIDYAQPLDADLTAIAALSTTATGRSALTFADPGVDRLPFFDDSASTMKLGVIADFTAEASPAAGDKVFIQRAGTDDLAIVDWDDLPGGGAGISNVVEDLSPTLGGHLEGASFTVGTSTSGIEDLHIEAGGSIDWANGEVTITETDANTLTLVGGSLVLPNAGLTMGASVPFSDAAGTLTLQNVDALDATTEATIEAAIDTLANLTSIQGRTVTLADAGANAIFGWDDTAGAYENLTAAEATAIISAASDTAAGKIEIADQAEQETGSDVLRAVTPGRQHFHPSAAKVFAIITVAAGTPTQQATSYNMTSIADTSPGVVTLTIGTDFSTANWACLATTQGVAAAPHVITNQATCGTFSKAAGSVVLTNVDATATQVIEDPVSWSLVGFGDI
jgi:hypothetical protein